MTLVVNPSSTGGSNDTSPAQCTTASMSVGRAGTSARSPSTTATRAAISRSTPPAASTTSAKIGFSSSLAIRSAPLIDPLGRTSTDIRTSGTSLSMRCSSASPTKPVTPVIRTCWPASRSATDPLTRRNPATSRRGRPTHPPPIELRCPQAGWGSPQAQLRCLSASRRTARTAGRPAGRPRRGPSPGRSGRAGAVPSRWPCAARTSRRRRWPRPRGGAGPGRCRLLWPTWQITAVRRSQRSSSVAHARTTGVAPAGARPARRRPGGWPRRRRRPTRRR